MNAAPLVFDIKRFALDDGPGIRTTVFLKGCPLACSWCHNPESIRRQAEMSFQAELCLGCGECAQACTYGAITDGPERVVRETCSGCGACAKACPSLALKLKGELVPVDELVQRLLADRVLYQSSGGGVTFSGGEPTLHRNYLARVLKRLKAEGIHTLVETCGLFDTDHFLAELLPYLDLIYFDVKFIDDGLHRRHTGRGNSLIQKNLAVLAQVAPDKLLPRVPLVPGITATDDNLTAIAERLRELGLARFGHMPYHPAGHAKARALGLPQPDLPETMLAAEDEARYVRLLRRRLCA